MKKMTLEKPNRLIGTLLIAICMLTNFLQSTSHMTWIAELPEMVQVVAVIVPWAGIFFGVLLYFKDRM